MTGPAHSGLMQVGDGRASNWSPAPGGGGGGWHPHQWGPNRFNGGRDLVHDRAGFVVDPDATEAADDFLLAAEALALAPRMPDDGWRR
jgi:hypothetical protein